MFTIGTLHRFPCWWMPRFADASASSCWANRNAFFYVLDRETGEFLSGKPFVKQTWAEGLDDKGKPIRRPNTAPSREGTLVYPGVQGGTNWYSPSYSPLTRLFYMSVWDYASTYYTGDADYHAGNRFLGSVPAGVTNDPGRGMVKALDPLTRRTAWVSMAGCH